MERRGGHPEAWLWETEEGRCWFTRLVVATLYTFGLKRGVGVETMSEFFARLRLETQVGCLPSALRGVGGFLPLFGSHPLDDREQHGWVAGLYR